ncbi:MAG TPA: hypothetical protein VGD27_13760 [Longimicrobiales bacterium]
MLALRLLAAVLAVLGVAPLWRLLQDPATGLAGAATAAQASAHSAVLWSGLLMCVVPGVLAAVLVDRNALDSFVNRMVEPLRRPRTIVFAAVLSLCATVLAALLARFVLGGVPILIDSFAQLLHARYFAAGMLHGPVSSDAPFWHIQQTIITPNGWVSQYPPGHVALLALGLKLHMAWLIGPLCWGVAVYFTTLALHELAKSTATARVAALLAALSPFGLMLSGAFMSHIPAAACAAAALYFVVRYDDHGRTAAAAGLALGVLFTMRPLTAVALAAVATAYALVQRRPRAAAVAFAAALPLLLLVAWYNYHFFGHPARFGYSAALGPHAGLGFGIDPWGNRYSLPDAIAYTTAELTSLSLFLFEAPLPLVLLVGSYFATGKRSAREWLLFGWCVAPVLAGLFYWHHGLFMGPRMLADVGVLWGALAVLSVIGLVRGLRSSWLIARRYSPRTFATATVLAAAVFGVVMLLPERLGSYRVTRETRALLKAPAIDEPALVFVHGGWTARIAMTLAAHGMRLDSVEAALRQNPTCRVQVFADSFSRGAKSSVQLDMKPRAVNLPAVAEIAPGNRIRVAEGEVFNAACTRQIRADQGGIIDVTPYVWQGDRPGARSQGALFVRDLGPEANHRLIRKYPTRHPLMLLPHADTVALVPYTIAERAIWPGTR